MKREQFVKEATIVTLIFIILAVIAPWFKLMYKFMEVIITGLFFF